MDIDLTSSRILSCIFTILSASALTLLVPCFATLIASAEKNATESPEAFFVRNLLAVAGPIASVVAMGSPLLAVKKSIFEGTDGLQWRLFAAFGISCVMGVAYGLRRNIASIFVSSLCGMFAQAVALSVAFHICGGRPRARYIIEAMGLRSGCAMEWFLWISFLLFVTAAEFAFVMVVPLEVILAPLYTLSCLFPYLAQFSTLSNDLKDYRAAEQPGKNGGADLRTLYIMEFNNAIWLSFGAVINDPVVVISGLASFLFASSQIIAYACPVFDLLWKKAALQGDTGVPMDRVCQRGYNRLVIDPAWIFVGSSFVETLHKLPDSDLNLPTPMTASTLNTQAQHPDQHTTSAKHSNSLGHTRLSEPARPTQSGRQHGSGQQTEPGPSPILRSTSPHTEEDGKEEEIRALEIETVSTIF